MKALDAAQFSNDYEYRQAVQNQRKSERAKRNGRVNARGRRDVAAMESQG